MTCLAVPKQLSELTLNISLLCGSSIGMFDSNQGVDQPANELDDCNKALIYETFNTQTSAWNEAVEDALSNSEEWGNWSALPVCNPPPLPPVVPPPAPPPPLESFVVEAGGSLPATLLTACQLHTSARIEVHGTHTLPSLSINSSASTHEIWLEGVNGAELQFDELKIEAGAPNVHLSNLALRGHIVIRANGTFEVRNCSFLEWTGTLRALHVNASASNVELFDVRFEGLTAGALEVSDGSVIAWDSGFLNLTADFGAAARVTSGVFTCMGCVLVHNEATVDGGAFAITDGHVLLGNETVLRSLSAPHRPFLVFVQSEVEFAPPGKGFGRQLGASVGNRARGAYAPTGSLSYALPAPMGYWITGAIECTELPCAHNYELSVGLTMATLQPLSMKEQAGGRMVYGDNRSIPPPTPTPGAALPSQTPIPIAHTISHGCPPHPPNSCPAAVPLRRRPSHHNVQRGRMETPWPQRINGDQVAPERAPRASIALPGPSLQPTAHLVATAHSAAQHRCRVQPAAFLLSGGAKQLMSAARVQWAFTAQLGV
jgi:hypothetical protein